MAAARPVLYENKSPTRWNGYMITEPTASSSEPTVLDVEWVTAFVVFSACCDAQPGVLTSSGDASVFYGALN